MNLLLYSLISVLPCDQFLSQMEKVHNVREAKLGIVTMRKHISSEEMDRGVMLLLHRIHNKHSNTMPTTAQDREDLTIFLFRIAKEK